MKSKFSRKNKISVVAQVFSLVISTIAFAYILGSAFPVVSANEEGGECTLVNGVYAKLVGNKLFTCGSSGCTDSGETAESFCIGYPQICNSPSAGSYSIKSPVVCPKKASQPPGAPTQATGTPNPAPKLTAPLGIADIALRGVTPQPVQPQVPASGSGTGTTPASTGLKKIFEKKILGLQIGWILETAGVAYGIYNGGRFVLKKLGASPEFAAAASNAVTVMYVITRFSKLPAFNFLNIGGSVLGIPVAGIILGVLIFILTFKKTRYDLYQFTCYPWDAPLGGRDCEKCNQGDFPCTEYRCRSLGQACQLENPGTGEELCVWKNRNDARPPVIKAWTETLTKDYKYIPDNAISPPNRGVRIVPEDDNNGCIAANIPLKFGVTLDEPAKCKIDSANKDNFDDMDSFFGGSSTTKYNHSQTMSLPSIQALEAENITLENNGEFALYARCQDANGNPKGDSPSASFVFRFCVDKGPDTTPPKIVTTSILNGFPISFGTTSADLQVYVNEPAECKWSKTDQSYDSMENIMSCNMNVLEVNAQALYKCSTTLNGLNDGVNNDFYFRCKDQPSLEGTNISSQRNANSQSTKFTLVGTRPLVIDSVKPNGTISDSTNIIKVTLEAKTSAGFDEGAALCYFSDTGEEGSYVQFFTTGTHQHSQDLFLAEGDYNYYIRCTDLGGNTDTKTTSFVVESDSEAPVVVRAFKEENFLKIITDEEASCVYSTSTQNACNYLFEDGIKMQSLEKNKHQIAWNPDMTFYIKCEDDFKNQPLPNECSIIARPFGK